MINFPNERQRRKLLVVSGGRFSLEIFWILALKVPFPGFPSHSGGILARFQLGNYFLSLKIYLFWKIWPICIKPWKLVWICAWTRVDNLMIQSKFFPFSVVRRCFSEIMNIRETYNNRKCQVKRIKEISRHNFCSCEKKPKTIEACVGFKNLTSAIPVQCRTNWFTCNKPTGSRSLSRLVISPWKDDDEIPYIIMLSQVKAVSITAIVFF